MYHIFENIYLSNLIDASNQSLIEKNKIGAVLRLSEDINSSIYRSDIVFKNFEVEDNILSRDEFIQASNAIANLIDSMPDRNILIHCNEGQSRSVGAIMYYLISRKGVSYNNAMNLLRTKNPKANPNSAFKAILMRL